MFGLASDRDEQSAVLALVGAAGSVWPWHRIADAIADVGSAIKIIDGDWSGFEDEDASLLHAMAESAHAKDSLEKYRSLIEEEEASGSHLLTVLDSDYPVNLREVYNRPPFLFVRGQLTPADDRAIAVVGTRQATEEGLDQAFRLADGLAREGVTVLSGMALGIDTAAHRAALAGRAAGHDLLDRPGARLDGHADRGGRPRRAPPPRQDARAHGRRPQPRPSPRHAMTWMAAIFAAECKSESEVQLNGGTCENE